MRSTAPFLSTFVVCAALGCFLTHSPTAEAFWKRRHASSCFYDSFDKDDVWNGHYFVNNNSSTSTVYLVCPVDDDDTTPKQNFAEVKVHGHDGNGTAAGSVEAKTCVAYWDSNGGTCATPSNSSATGTGSYSLSPSLSKFTSDYSSDFGYVNVILPPMSGSRSTLRGIYIKTEQRRGAS